MRSGIEINVEDYFNEGSGDLEFTDDEDFELTGDFNLGDSIVQKMLGIWKQVDTIDMDAYLEAEDVSVAYRHLSGFFPPSMRFFEKETGFVLKF